MPQFFPMRKQERWFMVTLIAFSVLSFLPWWRVLYFAGMSLFGWWMVALMVLSPTAALVIFLLEKRHQRRGVRGSP